MPKVVNMYDAKTQLSALVDQAASGNDVIIARNGKPQARITSLVPAKGKIKYGLLKGKLTVPDTFDAPNPDIEALFYGGPK
ncbi:MAG: type II toxin-antitoxin system prevent-host-death family antitoxin [Holophaga sp.]|nr:type II toxin-antitoxin system prevent-host-death family antitoxin [Holophaga sp.]